MLLTDALWSAIVGGMRFGAMQCMLELDMEALGKLGYSNSQVSLRCLMELVTYRACEGDIAYHGEVNTERRVQWMRRRGLVVQRSGSGWQVMKAVAGDESGSGPGCHYWHG